MMKLDNFIGMMTGHFDNKEQFNMMQATGKIYPYAKHVNTVCNDKINNTPIITQITIAINLPSIICILSL